MVSLRRETHETNRRRDRLGLGGAGVEWRPNLHAEKSRGSTTMKENAFTRGDEAGRGNDSVNLTGCRILLVEDSPDDQRLMTVLLTSAGADVTLECNGQAAIERVFSQRSVSAGVDLIVMDLEMPILDGIGATRQLRDMGFDRPIIAVTAYDLPGKRQRWFDAGCDQYLTKPLQRETFLQTIGGLVHLEMCAH